MLITTSGLRVTFGGRTLFTDLDLGVGSGEIVGLHGPSGCGTSTVLAVLHGHLEPTAGVVDRPGGPG